MNMKYKIIVRNLSGFVLTFSVEEYKVIDGFVEFIDNKTKLVERHAVSNCQIQEVAQ
jgi:hypothetical protein